MFEPARIMGTSATMIETLCVIPTAALLEETTKPLHRAILLNFWRHVHLEGAGITGGSWRRT